jgi:DNA-binding transcriptional MerR regulator
MSAMDRHLSPAETAKRFGITVKALRLYERHGLLKPARTKSGWRAYGPGQIARLHQIIALKRLGLPLARIGALLKDAHGLDDVLALQERALAQGSEKLARALTLVRSARAKLASGAALSIDDLANLTKETVLTDKANREELKALLTPVLARHFTPEERARMSQVGEAHKAQWADITAKAQAAMATGDPASPEARELAQWFRAVRSEVAGDDPQMKDKMKAVRAEVLADANISSLLPISPELGDFIRKAMALLD